MQKDEKPYRQIFKSMSLFGGVQLLTMLMSVVKNKIIAMWLGAEGLGMIGLYTVGIETLTSVTGLGLRNSLVREIAKTEDETEANRYAIIALARKWSLWAGIFGLVVAAVLSPLMSRWSFGNDTHIWGFFILSITLLFNALLSGEHAILQGTGRLKRLAYCILFSSASGLALSVLLYYMFGVKGIVPSILLFSLFYLIITYCFRLRGVSHISLSVRETFRQGRPVVMLGVYLVAASFMSSLSSYLIMSVVQERGGLSEVAYYQSGIALVEKYMGFLFLAMATDYFPRLSATKDMQQTNDTVNRQTEFSLLLLVPATLVFLLLQPFVITLLYTPDFYAVIPFSTWASLSIVFKAVTYPVAFVILTKGTGRKYFIIEAIFSIIYFLLAISFYHYAGLEGMGIALVIYQSLYTLFVIVYCYKEFSLRLGWFSVIWLVFGCILVAAMIALLHQPEWYMKRPLMYLLATVVAIISAVKLYKRIMR